MFDHRAAFRSLEAALRDVTHERAEVRLSALADLSRHAEADRSGRAALALREALTGDREEAVRAGAALAIADTEQRSFVEGLLRAVDDPSPSVREMVLLALGELGSLEHPRVADVVRAARASEHPRLRFQAVIATNKLGLPEASDALSAAAHDEDPEIRHVSIRILEERATSDSGEVTPPAETAALARELLRDPVLSVRLAAAILLARAGDRGGEAVLAEAVAHTDPMDAEDEQAAVVLAGELRVAAARAGLERRAFQRLFGRARFSYEAKIALARLGDSRARRSIARGLSAWSRDARTLAVVAAGHAELTEALPQIVAMQGDPSRAEPEAVELSLRLLRAAGA